jgi:diketogulonate reductase-like aldo/keto reductase
LLKWALQRGTSIIPKAYSAIHIHENISVLEMAELPAEDMARISKLNIDKGDLRFMDPSNYWGFDIFNSGKDEP